jgi:hypothetical protein
VAIEEGLGDVLGVFEELDGRLAAWIWCVGGVLLAFSEFDGSFIWRFVRLRAIWVYDARSRPGSREPNIGEDALVLVDSCEASAIGLHCIWNNMPCSTSCCEGRKLVNIVRSGAQEAGRCRHQPVIERRPSIDIKGP